jgi:glutathione S-transferase
MKHQYRLYGVQVSLFVGKVRGYLNFKGLDYQEKAPTVYDLLRRFPNKVGAAVMPVIKSRDGEWLADSTDIIETLERRHPFPSIRPASPRQIIAAMLFEAWCDDVWHPVALHTRWSFPENYPLFRSEIGKGLLPYAPGFLQNWVVDSTAAARMRDAKPRMGVTPEQIAQLEQWTTNILDLLENHFTQHDYLFGGRPTIADFSLLGPLYGHLSLDPWPQRELIASRPNIKDYIERMHRGDKTSGDFLENDEIPSTLRPIFDIIFAEFYPLLSKTVELVNDFVARKGLQKGDALPRTIAKVSFPMGEGEYTRHTFSYALWMMQRIQKQLRVMPEHKRTSVSEWFADRGQVNLLEMNFGPAVERAGLTVRLAG